MKEGVQPNGDAIVRNLKRVEGAIGFVERITSGLDGKLFPKVAAAGPKAIDDLHREAGSIRARVHRVNGQGL